MIETILTKARHWWHRERAIERGGLAGILTGSPAERAAAHHSLAKAALEAGNWTAAIESSQQAIALDPTCGWYHHTLGKASAGAGDWIAAIAAFAAAIEQDPTISWFHYEQGCASARLGNWPAAIAALERSIALNPEFVWAYHQLGEIWLDQEQGEQAIGLYQQAIRLCPQEPIFQAKLAVAQHLQSGAPMRLEILRQHPPKLHQVFGKPASLGLSDAVLDFLDQQVQPGWRTLETGAGISTLLFALKQSKHPQGEHHCIVPDPDLVARLQAYSQRHQIPIERVTFHVDRSETVLPQLQLQDLDLVLIDGRHAFPSPFIDWYYGSNYLRVGGLCIVDDTQLWTGDVLKQFLCLESEWQLIADLPIDNPNSAVFRKLAAGSHEKWWLEQPYAVQQCPQSIQRLAQ